jgi:hypothetical protein
MVSFTSLLWVWKGEAAGSWHFVTVPEEQAAEIKAEALAGRRGFGSVRVEARIGAVSWRTSVFPLKGGGYLLPVKASVRKEAALAAGDQVAVDVEVI